MKTLERNNTNDVVGMIRTLGVLFVAIILKNNLTGSFSWQWPIAMMVVIAALLVVNAFVTFQQKRRRRNAKEINLYDYKKEIRQYGRII